MVGARGALAATIEAHTGPSIAPPAACAIGGVVAAEGAPCAVQTRTDDGAPGGDVEGAAVGVEGFARDVELFGFV